jgi:uncharacterized protein YwqG
MNYRFNLEEWLARFPLASDVERYSGEIITSPCDICNNEWLRREMQDQFKWGKAVPIDVFIMAEGEPDNRYATKIGGLPYRPAAAQWPLTSLGHPMTFFAQFNFSDSRDLFDDLPGDLLLIFADDSNETINSLEFEWQRIGLDDLVSVENLPDNPDAFQPCFGHICRTASFPKAKRAAKSKRLHYPTCREKEVRSDYHLLQYQGTQIGSAPFFIQDDPDLLGRVLCTISSVQPDQHQPYPWVNHPEPLAPKGQWNFSQNHLMIGDMGCIYISIDDDLQLHWNDSFF